MGSIRITRLLSALFFSVLFLLFSFFIFFRMRVLSLFDHGVCAENNACMWTLFSPWRCHLFCHLFIFTTSKECSTATPTMGGGVSRSMSSRRSQGGFLGSRPYSYSTLINVKNQKNPAVIEQFAPPILFPSSPLLLLILLASLSRSCEPLLSHH